MALPEPAWKKNLHKKKAARKAKPRTSKATVPKKPSVWFWIFAVLGIAGSLLFVVIAWALYWQHRKEKGITLPKALLYWDTAMLVIRLVFVSALIGVSII
jgi:hypothetical protein